MEKAEILKNIIENRQSIYPKDYSGEAIPESVLQEILNSANFAPNHKKTSPWRFKIIRNDELKPLGAEMQRLYKENTPEHLFLQKKYDDFAVKISQTYAVISIVVNFSGLVPEWEEIAAVAMAVQNMYLTASANNVGCYWSSHEVTSQLDIFLNLEENQRCLGLFYLGMKKD